MNIWTLASLHNFWRAAVSIMNPNKDRFELINWADWELSSVPLLFEWLAWLDYSKLKQSKLHCYLARIVRFDFNDGLVFPADHETTRLGIKVIFDMLLWDISFFHYQRDAARPLKEQGPCLTYFLYGSVACFLSNYLEILRSPSLLQVLSDLPTQAFLKGAINNCQLRVSSITSIL